ncbi:hypothetical protein GOBAR_AA13017 [Gossypium barbadense]|uniref:Uncharacterized protein n=1 Tax=Gossypium barbadense TaxID=3634 RepID=A0A2P5XWE7_GOSBA|nr:hypothetical protein GOBAR_AA13017 [Gossypium barbadense]
MYSWEVPSRYTGTTCLARVRALYPQLRSSSGAGTALHTATSTPCVPGTPSGSKVQVHVSRLKTPSVLMNGVLVLVPGRVVQLLYSQPVRYASPEVTTDKKTVKGAATPLSVKTKREANEHRFPW